LRKLFPKLFIQSLHRLQKLSKGPQANPCVQPGNIANFIKRYDLDGVDIDWKYSGAPDVPDILAGSKGDDPYYLAFHKLLKGLVPGKTLFIAAPELFWYLKGFQIMKITRVIDYIIYMAWDWHGESA
jgi:GH18 family chitinase